MTEEELLAGIAAHPDEGDRWLVLADWLEDQSDPRAELVRLRWQYHYQPDHAEFEARRQRLVTLQGSALAPVIPTITNSLGMSLALIPPGAFWMGSPAEESDHRPDELLHQVTLTQPFFLGIHPVTVGDFRRFVTATDYKTEAERGDGAKGYNSGSWVQTSGRNWRTPRFAQRPRNPVVCVSWNDAQKMIRWLNKQEAKTGLVYSLPTEAQWEYACRAGTQTAYFWGDEHTPVGEYAWYKDNAKLRTRPVAEKKPNAWGLYDMAGQVWEYCHDSYAEYPEGPAVDPPGADASTPRARRVQRGGSWFVYASYCRAAHRAHDAQNSRDTHSGFRLAASLAQKS
jgi:uncharacterized protein (TIGR02996 family)